MEQELQEYLRKKKSYDSINLQKKEAAIDQTKKIGVVISVIVVVVLLASFLVYRITSQNNQTTYVQIDKEKNYIVYDGMTIKFPYSKNYSVNVENDVVVITGKFDMSINEILPYVHPAEGKSFTTSGEFAKVNGRYSFAIRKYCNARVLYYSNGSWSNAVLDAVFVGDTRFALFYLDQNERLPLEISSSSKYLGITINNRGSEKLYMNDDQVYTIEGQYTDGTKVTIKLCKESI